MNKTLWMQMVLPYQSRQPGLDICHFTNNVAPLYMPCPTVMTIHDMTLWLFPGMHYFRRLVSMRPFIPLAARRAAAIITVSYSASLDIMNILKIPSEKVHVIYEAPSQVFRPLPHDDHLEAVRQRYGLPEHFILFVGTLEPRKNLARLLQAFDQLRRQDHLPHHLVLIGARGWKTRQIDETIDGLSLQDAVHLPGYVPVEDLVALLNLADTMAFPSLYEGFGLPIVEAMACGTPVVTSRCGALQEIAGDAAEFVEPTDVDSIAEGLRRVLTNSSRQQELRALGFANAARFSWEVAARQTYAVYQNVLGDL
jgi:glycosyltransferase involved in cell wall biosynthesis